MNPTRWLVGHDFSPSGERAAEVAATDLSRLGGELHLIHVYSVPSVPLSYEWGPADGLLASPRDLETALKADVVRSVEDAAERLRERFPDVEVFTQVHAGRPAEALLAAAEELGADRIVVGTAGRTGLSHLLLGSVAERVVRLASCPVLVVKGPPHDDTGARGEPPGEAPPEKESRS